MRYLTQEEKEKSRELWEKAFPEDSRSFDDYYFSEKTKNNRILVKEEDGEIISMAHQNPYVLCAGHMRWTVDYIVGVATRADRRHRGHMRDILHEMFLHMYQERQPFTFLMPASPDIYRPFGFTYIFDQPVYRLREAHGLKAVPCWGAREELEAAGDFCQQWLESRYQVFCKRDLSYMKQLFLELSSENGQMEFLYRENPGSPGNAEKAPVGLRCQWGLEKTEQRLLYCQEEFTEKEDKAKPAIMARIINLREFVKAICLKEDCPRENIQVMLQAEDPILPENNGLFLWHLDKKGSRLGQVQELAAAGLSKAQSGDHQEMFSGEEGDNPETELLSLNITQLTSWLFGYETQESHDWRAFVKALHPVFLDEVV